MSSFGRNFWVTSQIFKFGNKKNEQQHGQVDEDEFWIEIQLILPLPQLFHSEIRP